MFAIEITWLLIVLSLANFTDLLKCLFHLSVSISDKDFIFNIKLNTGFCLSNPSPLVTAQYEYLSVGYPAQPL